MSGWKEQTLGLWRKLGKKQKYLAIGVAVGVFVLILAWSYWLSGRNDYVPLFTNLEAKDAGEVAAKLKELKTPYEIGNNGTTIMVPPKDVYRIRLELASQGLPRGNKGFEIFDQNKFGATEFQNKVYLLQALQGELTRTIEQMDEVEKARVHIVMAEDSLYKKNEKPATASIMLKLRPGSQLSKAQIQGIVNLVAHSIKGLKPENVTVVDNFAQVLNEQNDTPGLAGSATITQIELTKKVQEDLQRSAQSLLEQVLGPGKAAARVNVELNFDQRVVDRQTFEPVVDDQGIVRSVQETKENFQGETSPTGGVPGTAANIPGYVAGSDSKSSNYEKKESTRNYEINEVKEKVVVAPGAIKRITVAVLVDAAINQAQQDSISKAVASTIGLNTARGDVISVDSIAFNTELMDKQRQEAANLEQQQNQMYWLKIAAGVLGIIFILFVIRLIARRRQNEQDLEITTMAATTAATVEAEPQPVEMSPQEKERQKMRESLEKLARSKPDEVAQIIRAWLADE